MKIKVPQHICFGVKVFYGIISGYFTHVTTLAEVKEQVLKYIPVMARPLVLLREQHPIRWTGVYADIEVSDNRKELANIPNSYFTQFPSLSYRR